MAHVIRTFRSRSRPVPFGVLLLVVPHLSLAQEREPTALEIGAGLNYLGLAPSQWELDGGPGLDVIVGYRWSADATVRAVLGMSLAADGQLVAPSEFRPEATGGGTRHVIVPQGAVEIHFQPRAQAGRVDPSVGVRIGITGRQPGALGFGARGGARFHLTGAVTLEAGVTGDLVYLARRASASPLPTRGGFYIMLVGLQTRGSVSPAA
jgi:hypothetical protein